MKKMLLLVSLLGVLLSGFTSGVTTQFTVVNKSSMAIGVTMTGKYLNNHNDRLDDQDVTNANYYYLSIPANSQRTYQVQTGVYTVAATYIETWDPVYGYQCGSGASAQLKIDRTMSVTVLNCNLHAKKGDQTMQRLANVTNNRKHGRVVATETPKSQGGTPEGIP
jgi:hypothetical protein